MNAHENPPAFPRSEDQEMGMSLRDYFAAAALTGLATQQQTVLANNDLVEAFGTSGIDKLQANQAYRLADAMLAERAKQPTA